MAQLPKAVNPYERIDCPICCSTDSEILTRDGQFGIPLNVSICRACGFIFLNPRWSREKYQSFYERSYDQYYERDPADTDEDAGYLAMVQRLRRWKGDMDLSAPFKILDIGAGLGQGLTTLKRRLPNAELFGIEPSIEGSRSFSERGIKLVSLDVDSAWHHEYEGYFDIVVMRHVLEHFLDPHSVLDKVFHVLGDDAFLYLAVPSTDYAEFPLSKRFFRVVHTLYFSTEKLSWILQKHGLSPKVLGPGDTRNLGEIYAICVSQTQDTNSKPGNEYDALRNKITGLLRQEDRLSFRIYWALRKLMVIALFNNPVCRRIGWKKHALRLSGVIRNARSAMFDPHPPHHPPSA